MLRRAVLASAALAMMPSCGPHSGALALKYRLKLIAKVDGKVREGSTIIKVEWRDQRGAIAEVGAFFGVRAWGEALVVDLGEKHGLLFGLLSKRPIDRNYLSNLPMQVLSRYLTLSDEPDKSVPRMQDFRREVPLLQSEFPVLVRFRDISDPRTMRIIDPGNLAADYGSSVEIQSATLQITDASASKSIASLLPWVKDLNPRDLYRDPPMKIDAEIINRYYFERSG